MRCDSIAQPLLHLAIFVNFSKIRGFFVCFYMHSLFGQLIHMYAD